MLHIFVTLLCNFCVVCCCEGPDVDGILVYYPVTIGARVKIFSSQVCGTVAAGEPTKDLNGYKLKLITPKGVQFWSNRSVHLLDTEIDCENAIFVTSKSCIKQCKIGQNDGNNDDDGLDDGEALLALVDEPQINQHKIAALKNQIENDDNNNSDSEDEDVDIDYSFKPPDGKQSKFINGIAIEASQ